MSTSTSPLRPPPPRKSPTASQSSPIPFAIASTASATASSYGRPLAVPRAASASTAANFSRSDRSPANSSFNATICSRIASSDASWRTDASRAARRCAALKSASGFDPSAEENWRSRSSRICADVSRITSRN